MYHIRDPFAHVPLLWKWLSVLFAELTGFAYACKLLLGKGRESDYDSFRLHSFELLEIDVVDPFVPQLYVGVGSMALGKHCRFHLVRIEDEHSTFFSSASDNSAFLFDEATMVVESNLHALFHDLADQDQILRYSWNMLDILDVGMIDLFVEGDISNMLNGVDYVIPCFHIAGSLGFSQFWKPICTRRHMIGCTRVDQPYIF